MKLPLLCVGRCRHTLTVLGLTPITSAISKATSLSLHTLMTQSYTSSVMTSAGGCCSDVNVRRCQLTNVRTKVQNVLFFGPLANWWVNVQVLPDYLLTSGWWEKLIHQPAECFYRIWCQFVPWSVVDRDCLRVRGERKKGGTTYMWAAPEPRNIFKVKRGDFTVCFFTGRATWRAIYHDLSTAREFRRAVWGVFFRTWGHHVQKISKFQNSTKIIPSTLAYNWKKGNGSNQSSSNASTCFLLCAKLQNH